MSRMKEELEKRLDQNKYELYYSLKEIREWFKSEDVKILGKGFTEQFGLPKTFERIDKVLKKVEEL